MLPSLCFAILMISSTIITASVSAVMQFVNGSSSLISIRENIGSVPDVELLLDPLLLKAGLIFCIGMEFSLSMSPDKKKVLFRVSKGSSLGNELGCSR